MSSDSGVRIQAINDAANAINTMKVGGDPLIFLGTGGTETARIDSSGNVGIGTSPSVKLDIDNGSLKVNRGNSSGDIAVFRGLNAEKVKIDTDGIKFNGDTAAANALHDYEEGSWTPDIRRNDGTVSATFTVGTGTATYVKIGRVVHLKCWLHTISNGSSNGSSYWRVNGLPFTGTQYSGSASGYNSLTPNSLYIGDAGGNIILTSDTTPYTGSLLGTIMINITYETNS